MFQTSKNEHFSLVDGLFTWLPCLQDLFHISIILPCFIAIGTCFSSLILILYLFFYLQYFYIDMENTRSGCECQYTLTLTDELVQRQVSEMKDNFNHVPSMHKVNEEQNNYHREDPNAKSSRTNDSESRNIQDDEFAYTSEFFYSDNSSDESETPNIALQLGDDLSCISPGEDLKQIITSKLSKIDINNSKDAQDAAENRPFTSSSYSVSDDLFERKQQQIGQRDIKSKRKNMTFTDDQVRRIEYENQLLLRKIMAQQKPREKTLCDGASQFRTCSSAINRKKLQKKIDYDNMLLLRRIQQARSCVTPSTSKPGSRLTFL